MVESPPRQVLRHRIGGHDAIDPCWHVLRFIVLDIASMGIDNQHLAEDIAGIAPCWLHQRDRPVGMEAVVEFQRRINQLAIGIATQVDVTQQVLIENRARQVGDRVRL